MIGAITWVRAALVFISQMLAAMSAAAVVSALFPGQLNVAVTLGGNTSTAQGLCEWSGLLLALADGPSH